MKGRIVALDKLQGRPAAALIVDGKLEDFLIDPATDSAPRSTPSSTPGPGTVFRVTCDRALKGQGGMMVRIPGGTGFLRHGKGLRPGQTLLAQVTGYGEPGKAVPLTSRVLFKSRYAIVTPAAPGINVSRAIKDEEQRVRLHEIGHDCMAGQGDTGLILRSVAESGADAEVADDIAAMLNICSRVMSGQGETEPELLLAGPDAHELAWRDWAQPDLLADSDGSFEAHGVLDLTDAVLSSRLILPGGAYAFVEPTRALVAIDVNTGSDTSPAAALKANIALAKDLPRILRCRGLGGQITIDFAPLAKKDRRQMEQVLKAAFRRDSIETAQAGWTPLGHFELQRKRERLPVDESLLK